MSNEDASNAFYAALLDDDAVSLYERAPCGYLSTTPDGTIIKVNQTFLEWTGYRRSDLLGRKRFAELLTAGGRIYHETHYAPMLHMQGIARQIALDITRADGGRLPVLVNAVLERDQLGAPLVVRTAIFDATERRGYERELLLATRRAEEAAEHAKLLVRTLQQTLIPVTPPAIPGLEVAAGYRPAGLGEEVGGDFYDVFEIGPGDWMMAIGDVRGKGVEAAVVTAQARHTIRAAAVRQPFPRDVLRTLNDELLRYETDRFCTVALLRLRHAQGVWTATVSSGGHPLPLLCRTGAEVFAIGAAGSLLGLFETDDFHDRHIALRPGDALVLYTDGVTEGRQGRDFFGEERLAAAIVEHSSSASGLAEGILSDVLEFQAGRTNDDIAVVAVRVPTDEVSPGYA